MEDIDAEPNIIRTKDVHLIDGPFIFPLREAIIRAKAERLAALVREDLDREAGSLGESPSVILVDRETQTSDEQITVPPPTVQEHLDSKQGESPSSQIAGSDPTSGQVAGSDPSGGTNKSDDIFEIDPDAINPITGKKLKKPNKGSSRPPHILPQVWTRFGGRDRLRAIQEYEEYLEKKLVERLAKEALESAPQSSTTSGSTTTNTTTTPTSQNLKPEKQDDVPPILSAVDRCST